MLSFFTKKSPIQKLEKELNHLLEEAFKLSSINRKKSDEKIYEAEQIAIKLQELRKAEI